MRPLVDSEKKVTRVKEVLQCAAGQVRRLDKEMPPVLRGNRCELKPTSEMTRDLNRAREAEENWSGYTNALCEIIARVQD